MPWNQANFTEYMRIVRVANSHYERFKKSRIHTFTGLLKMKRFQNNAGHLQAIQAAWNAAPADAQRLYAAAWAYVQSELFPAPPPVVAPRVVAPRVVVPRGGVAIMGGQAVAQQAQVRAVRRENRVESADQVVNEALSQTLNGMQYDWTVRFRIRRVQAGRQSRSLSVIIKLAAFSGNGVEFRDAARRREVGSIPATHVGATVTDEVKRNWSSRINERWNGGTFVVQDISGDDLDVYDIDFGFEWAGSDEDTRNLNKVFAVRVTDPTQPPDGTIDTHFWGVDDGGTTGAAIAHEFGHLIGNPDEYGACTFKGSNNTRDRTSIMDNETTGQAKSRHLWLIGTHAATLLGADPARCVVRMNTVSHRVGVNHPWA
ncbi:MAG TPA: hypothetical protein VGX94_05460 [Terriglobia bacterium]|nr:hypothetical protein [Terriglobia bacterium]